MAELGEPGVIHMPRLSLFPKSRRSRRQAGASIVEYVALVASIAVTVAPSIWGGITGNVLLPMCIVNTSIIAGDATSKLVNLGVPDGAYYYFVWGVRPWTETFDMVCTLKVKINGIFYITHLWEKNF